MRTLFWQPVTESSRRMVRDIYSKMRAYATVGESVLIKSPDHKSGTSRLSMAFILTTFWPAIAVRAAANGSVSFVR